MSVRTLHLSWRFGADIARDQVEEVIQRVLGGVGEVSGGGSGLDDAHLDIEIRSTPAMAEVLAALDDAVARLGLPAGAYWKWDDEDDGRLVGFRFSDQRPVVLDRPNMVVQQPSRKRLRPGDIFAIHIPVRGFLFGRVIFAQLPKGPMGPGSSLIYIYDHVGSKVDDFDDAELTPGRLLLPPTIINRLPWSRGYFQNVHSRPLTDRDVLPVHCFYDAARRTVVDLDGEQATEPCTGPRGFWGLDSFWTVDIRLSKVLGLGRD